MGGGDKFDLILILPQNVGILGRRARGRGGIFFAIIKNKKNIYIYIFLNTG